MWKNFRVWLFNLVNPPMEEYQIDEAKKLLVTITSRYSIEEQSDIVHKLKQELIAHRTQEIADTQFHLSRLQDNLTKIKLKEQI
jgi:hypothetical protein